MNSPLTSPVKLTKKCIHQLENGSQAKTFETEMKGCSVPMMILLSGPRLCAAMSMAAQFSALSPFLENLLPSYAVSLAQLMGPLLGLLVSPVIGSMSDTCTSRFGRRRPFLVFGALSYITCWIILGFSKDIGEALGDTQDDRLYTTIIAMTLYVWLGITFSAFATPAQLILADFAGDRQTTAASIGQAAFTLGILSVGTYIELSGNPSQSLLAFLGTLSLIMCIIVGLVCVFAHEKQLAVDPSSLKKSGFQSLKENIQLTRDGMKQMPTQMLILGAVFFCRCYGSTSYHGSKGQFFGLVVYNGDSYNADQCNELAGGCTEAQRNYNEGVTIACGLTDILFSTLCYVGSWMVPFFVRCMGARKVVIVGMLPQVLLIIMGLYINREVDITIAVLSSITQAFVDSTLVPLILTISQDRDDGDIGIYVGAFNTFDCMGQLVDFGMSAALVNTSMGYALPMVVGGGVSFVGFVIALVFLKADTRKY